MEKDIRDEEDWQVLLSFLPYNLTEIAMETGALSRTRKIKSGADLLRLNLVYSDPKMSLRQVSAWSGSQDIEHMSDVAVLKRLRASTKFLRAIVSKLLPPVEATDSSLRLVALDATTLGRARCRKVDFRVHVSYDVASQSICGVELTDWKGGEKLTRARVQKGDVVVADRGYPARNEIAGLTESGAEMIVRFHLFSLKVQDELGKRISIYDRVRFLKIGEVLDLDVSTLPGKEFQGVSGRIVILRKTEKMVEQDEKRLKARAKEDKREVGVQARAASRYICLFTTLKKAQATGKQILDIYRFRWQIEMLFKRVKGVISLGETQARDFALCEAAILSQLITLLLIQACESAFFPWGYRLSV